MRQAAKPGALTNAQAKALTAQLLGHLDAKAYAKALAMMAPVIRQTITADHLRRQDEINRRVLGAFRKGTLSLVSRLTLRGQTRLVWRANFKREAGMVLVLFDDKQHLVGFVIQSPSLVKSMRKERPVSQPPQMQQFNRQADDLMTGYNKGQWALFCKHCSKVMKQVFADRFVPLRKVLLQRYGKYKSRKLHQVRTLVSLQDALVIRYKAAFDKRQGVILQFVFQKTSKGYKVAGWRVK